MTEGKPSWPEDLTLLSADTLLADYDRWFYMRGKNRAGVKHELALRNEVLRRLKIAEAALTAAGVENNIENRKPGE